MTDEFRTRNSLSGEVGDNSRIVQVQHLNGDVLFLAGPKRSASATHPRPSTNAVEHVMLAATAIAAIALLGWRYLLSASQRRASR